MRFRGNLFFLLALPSLLACSAARAADPVMMAVATFPRPRPVVPQQLRWDAPEALGVWGQAELQDSAPGGHTRLGGASAGLNLIWSCDDFGLVVCGGLRIASRPHFSTRPAAATAEGGTDPTLRLGFAQEAELDLHPGVILRVRAEIGSLMGLGRRGTGEGAVAKARMGATVDMQALNAGLPVRLGLSVSLARNLAPPAGERPDGCDGVLEISIASFPPLRIAAPCTPEPGATRIGFGVRRRF
ncbi:hypothetical protein [Falsiroseomonas sp.]|uniref:hypothetical protein n=1 Tax=Falsiroseomonas sp. TaxID=2870721 RepID=UPI003569F305